MTINDHGIPVATSRQWTTALSPNAAHTDWNVITGAFDGAVGAPVEWPVTRNLTTTPITAITNTTTHHYPNSNFGYTNQLRAQNGRIFFPLFGGNTAYYDPTTEIVLELATVPEVPPVDPNASTTFYQASFDVGGLLYLGTQESQNRRVMIVVTDTTTTPPAQTIVGYVGSGALGYTTYAFHLAPDTVTATKTIYVVYGENPWQLWSLDITTGIGTKLDEVPSVGNMQFTDIPGQGWVVTVDTYLGSPTNVRTERWCLDGVLYPYTLGVPPPGGRARNVTPASNPLVLPPELDISGGVGIIGWRPHGSTGVYTYVNYSVVYTLPVAIESIVDSTPNNGVVANAAQYSGFVQYVEPADTHTWYGPWSNGLSQGPRLNVNGALYLAGYPNGVLYRYDPAVAWDIHNAPNNPILLGNYGLNGTQFAGIKYATDLAWGALAGASGRLFCCGSRERNGVGSGIGSWDRTTHAFAGTYAAAGMDVCLPDGMCVLAGISRVVMSTHLITPPGTAKLFIFDYDMTFQSSVTVIAGLAALGKIYETTTPNVIAGIVQGSGNSIGIWQYNVQTLAFVQYVELPVIGVLGQQCQQFGGSVWLMSGNNLVRVNVSAITATVFQDMTSIVPVVKMGFASDQTTLWFAGAINSTVAGAQLFSTSTGNAIAGSAGAGIGAGGSATFSIGGSVTIIAGPGAGIGAGGVATIVRTVDPVVPNIGDRTIQLLNGESTDIVRGQPVYIYADGTVRLAAADNTGSAIIAGFVADDVIRVSDVGNVVVVGDLDATTAQWDAICGTVGGLAFGVVYYLHPTIPGRMTAVAPSSSGQQVTRAMKAVSPIQAVIATTPPVLL